MNVACSQTLHFVFKVRRAGVINNYFSFSRSRAHLVLSLTCSPRSLAHVLTPFSRSRARLVLSHANVFQKKNKTPSVYRLWWMETPPPPKAMFAPYRTAFPSDAKSCPLYYEHLSVMWLSTLEISALHLRWVSEMASKSPFFCVVRSHIRSDFRIRHKSYPE